MTPDDYLTRKFDTYEAHYAYAVDYHKGKGSRSYALLGKLQAKGFKAGFSLANDTYGALTDEGQAIYERIMDRGY